MNTKSKTPYTRDEELYGSSSRSWNALANHSFWSSACYNRV